jgi:hypothetical protein
MSKGPGRVERIIESAFKANPDGYFSVEDLAKLAYPDCRPGYRGIIERSKRVAILRAAHNVANRLHWLMLRAQSRRWEAIFVNGLSLESYSLGEARARFGAGTHYQYARDADGKLIEVGRMTEIEYLRHRLKTDDAYYGRMMAPGGVWALTVEYHTAIANGDAERVGEVKMRLDTKEDAERQAMEKAFREFSD